MSQDPFCEEFERETLSPHLRKTQLSRFLLLFVASAERFKNSSEVTDSIKSSECIVACGRGVRTREDLALAQELAEALGEIGRASCRERV